MITLYLNSDATESARHKSSSLPGANRPLNEASMVSANFEGEGE